MNECATLGDAELAIRASGLGKCYQIYDHPQDRLKQALMPHLRTLLPAPVRRLWPAFERPRAYAREFWAVRELSFEVARGEAIGVIGRNGSGKSTLLQLLCNTLHPTTGSVEIHGRVAGLLELGAGFNPEFTGRENVFMNASVMGMSGAEIDARFPEIEAFAGIGDFIEQPVKSYSSGMYIRLAFATAIHTEPDVLVVDEALSVGDMVFQYKCMERIHQLIANGTTLFFVAHDLGMVKALCQRAIYLENGWAKAIGPADEVAEQYTLDARAAQAGEGLAQHAVEAKPFDGGGDGIAFGTDQGAISNARFASGGQREFFATGDALAFVAEVRYDASIKNPSLSVVVNDKRLIPVGGRYVALSRAEGEGMTRVLVRGGFEVPFVSGEYFITLRLEDRMSSTHFKVVDKQVGVLAFEIHKTPGSRSLGMVELGIDLSADGDEGNDGDDDTQRTAC